VTCVGARDDARRESSGPGGGHRRAEGLDRQPARAAGPAAHLLLPAARHHLPAARTRPGHGAVRCLGGGPRGEAVPLRGPEEAATRLCHRPARDVDRGPVVAEAVPGTGLPAARGLGGRAGADADPRRRRLAERRGPLDPARRTPVPALRTGQAGAGAVGRRPAGAQGEAGSARRLASSAGAADARHRRAVPAGDGGERPGHHVHPADDLPRAAVGDRHARSRLRRPADPHVAGHPAHDDLVALPLGAAHRVPPSADRPDRRADAAHPGPDVHRLRRHLRRGPRRRQLHVGLGTGVDQRLHLRHHR